MKKAAPRTQERLFHFNTPAMTYFHMGRPHTIIGAKQFHFRVRDGIGWYPLAMVAGNSGGDPLAFSVVTELVR